MEAEIYSLYLMKDYVLDVSTS